MPGRSHEYLCGAVEYSPFYGIEKGAVLQEARMFNDRSVDPRRCQQVRLLVRLWLQSASCMQLFGIDHVLRSACSQLPHPSQVITKLLYLLSQGETFSKVRKARISFDSADVANLPCRD